MSNPENYDDLLNTIGLQEQIINSQNETIARLVNDNAEKENMINELGKQLTP